MENRSTEESFASENEIRITGARQNNLKNVSLSIPRDKLTVITGVSGSGKSSLAFDTIYAEGQMRYVESLSPYARQFLGQRGRPDVIPSKGFPRRSPSSRNPPTPIPAPPWAP